jgi:hypothetical protein
MPVPIPKDTERERRQGGFLGAYRDRDQHPTVSAEGGLRYHLPRSPGRGGRSALQVPRARGPLVMMLGPPRRLSSLRG